MAGIAASTSWAQSREVKTIEKTGERNVELQEVIIKAKRQKYSKRNNPAVDFVELLRSRGDLTDPRNHDFYTYDRYERLTMALCPFDTTLAGKGNFAFLKDHADVSPLSGRTTLPLSVKEKASTVYYIADGKRQKEIVRAVSRNGIDEITDQEGTERILEDVMREIDLYQNDINLLQNRFVSPLSKIGPDFYMYFLTDTVTDPDGSRWIELSFTPRVNTTFGFSGRLYVAEGDSTMFVRKVKMGVPANINLNFVDRLNLEQTYERAPDGSRIKTSDEFQAEMSLIPGTPGIFVRRLSLFDNHTFQAPDSASRSTVDAMLGETLVLDDAEIVGADSLYWVSLREETISGAEQDVKRLMADLRRRNLYKYTERVIKVFSNGYVPTYFTRPSPFDFGPIFSFLSHDNLQGWRLMAGGITMPAFSRRWFLAGDVAYGFRDHRWKYAASVEYSFIDKTKQANQFPVRSVKLAWSDDVDYLGQQMTADGMLFESLQRSGKSLIVYKKKLSLNYTHELENHLSWNIGLSADRSHSTPLVSFTRPDGTSTTLYNTLNAGMSLRWAPAEKFFETRKHRLPINRDNLALELSLNASRVQLSWARFNLLHLNVALKKRFWLSAFGAIDLIVDGGKIFGTVPFPSLASTPSSMSYIIVPGSFTLADPMEFVGDLYGHWDITYKARGALFNRIPLLSKLRMREIIGFRGWWGRLSDKNNPLHNPMLLQFPYAETSTAMSRPYMEFSLGLDNILRFLRLEYTWRLSYRNIPGHHNGGLRVGIHFSF